MARGSRARAVFFGLLAAGGCAKPDVQIRALPDGTREFTCRHTLPQCLSHVDDVCKGASYEVLYAMDTQRMYGSPSSSEVESRTSQAVVHCMGIHDKSMAGAPLSAEVTPLPVLAEPSPSAAVSVATPPVPAVPLPVPAAPPRACVPGATQACVGPAACSGGQACLPDGSGFGSCDCGSQK